MKGISKMSDDTKKLSKRDQEFLRIKEKLMAFNNEELLEDGSENPDRKKIRIDYDHIYNIRSLETEDFNINTGAKFIRTLNDQEMKLVLAQYAKDSFNITLNKSLTFENMVTQLVDEVSVLNSEEEDFLSQTKKEDPSSKLFSPKDMLYAYETLIGAKGTNTTLKPNKESVSELRKATINMVNPNNTIVDSEVLRKLTDDEIKDIVDETFILGY